MTLCIPTRTYHHDAVHRNHALTRLIGLNHEFGLANPNLAVSAPAISGKLRI